MYANNLPYFFQTYLVYALSLVGMLTGLALGKHLLIPSSRPYSAHDYRETRGVSKFCSPRMLYLFGALASTACMFTASFLTF